MHVADLRLFYAVDGYFYERLTDKTLIRSFKLSVYQKIGFKDKFSLKLLNIQPLELVLLQRFSYLPTNSKTADYVK